MEPSQGEIIQKPKMQELSSLFMTHHINVMHALVKFREYIPYSLGVMARHGLLYGISQGEISQKPKMQELSSLIMTHRLIVMYAPVKFHVNSIQCRSYSPDTLYYMQLRQGKIIQKQKMQELSSLFMTHRINVMHALVKFHEYIP